MPKRQLIAAGFSHAMAELLVDLKNDAVADANTMLGLLRRGLNGRMMICTS
jgi:hypothetical protein